jgi:hypothetical protein
VFRKRRPRNSEADQVLHDLRTDLRQQAPISIAHRSAHNRFWDKLLFSGSFVPYVDDRLALSGVGNGVREEEAADKGTNCDANG